MKITLSKSQWELIGKTAGWTGNPELTPEQELAVSKVYSIINDDEELKDMLDDAVSEVLESNAKKYKGRGVLGEFSNLISERINMLQSVLLQLK